MMARSGAVAKACAWHLSIALLVVVGATGTRGWGAGGRGGGGVQVFGAAGRPGGGLLRISGGGSRGVAGFGEEQMFEASVLTPARPMEQQQGNSVASADGGDVEMVSPIHASNARVPAGGDGVALAEGVEGGVGGGEWEDDELNVEQELWDLEKELDDVYEAKAIAEKVNMQLKTALETQHMEIEVLRARINITEK